MEDLRIWIFTCGMFLLIVAPLLVLLRWLYMLGQGVAVEFAHPLNCPDCKTPVEPDWTHCPLCGAKIQSENQQEEGQSS